MEPIRRVRDSLSYLIPNGLVEKNVWKTVTEIRDIVDLEKISKNEAKLLSEQILAVYSTK